MKTPWVKDLVTLSLKVPLSYVGALSINMRGVVWWSTGISVSASIDRPSLVRSSVRGPPRTCSRPDYMHTVQIKE